MPYRLPITSSFASNLTRSLAAFQLRIIAVPMFFLSLSGWALLIISAMDFSSLYQRCAYIALVLFAPLCYMSCGALRGILASNGPEGLADTRRAFWVRTLLGVALVLIGFAPAFTATGGWVVRPFYGLLTRFSVFTLGAPMLLSALHVAVVRIRWRSVGAGNGA